MDRTGECDSCSAWDELFDHGVDADGEPLLLCARCVTLDRELDLEMLNMELAS